MLTSLFLFLYLGMTGETDFSPRSTAVNELFSELIVPEIYTDWLLKFGCRSRIFSEDAKDKICKQQPNPLRQISISNVCEHRREYKLREEMEN